ncbi:unnamed protein product [Paramecium primaurelia]|uniref:H-type lectin domain-containing protein n=1 Tax=Paramecium primaurelia TaxID=5886 RepID=A0A8S1PBE3_PARPR|nr:unnamed protein product [Paramecium primaurelia]
MKIAVLIAILSLAFCYRTPQYESAQQVIVQYAGGHILEAQAGVPRQVVVDVKFKKAFEVPPQVFISAQLLDWSVGLPHGFMERVSDITTTGFKLSGVAVGPSPLYSLFVDWYAIYDPRIQVVTFESTDVKELKTGIGERKVSYTIEHSLKDATNAIVSLIGCKHLLTNPIVEVKVEQVTPKSVTVSVRTYWQAQLEFIRFNVLLGTDQSLWVSPAYVFYNDPASSHPFVKRAPSAAEVPQTIELPKVWQSGPRVPIVTLRGYDVERARNMRLQYNKVVLESKLSYNLVTWWDTQIYGVFHQTAIFVADTTYKIFDPDCAELFSECNFKGDSVTVCDRIPDLPGYGWSKPIRSLTVPVSRRLYLFNKEKYEGQRTSFIANQQCMESITFSFAQLQSYEEEDHPVLASQ